MTTTTQTTYRITLSGDARGQGPGWGEEHETQDDAAAAIRSLLGWDSLVMSHAFTVDEELADGGRATEAVACYESTEVEESDEDGAYAPRIERVVRRAAE